jgi:dienelactone hydrolase
MPWRGHSKRVLAAVLLAVAALSAWAVGRYGRSAAFVVRAADLGGWPRALAERAAHRFTQESVTVPCRHRPLRGWLFRAEGGARRSVLLVPGVHAQGIDEPRLQALARQLASARLNVLAVEALDLPDYRITTRATDGIEDAALWLAGQAELSPDGRVGLIGISFAGGLSLVAAGRPALHGHVAFVTSVGGHGDLPRVLRFLCSGGEPGLPAPHDYGLVVVLLGSLERVTPPEQVPALREGVLAFLEGSHLAAVDKAASQAAFERARVVAQGLPEPSATLLRQVNQRDVAALGPLLLPHLEGVGGDPSLSPERSPPPQAPVFLLHGSGDNVIPAREARHLYEHLAPHTRVRLLVSPLLTHADVEQGARLREAPAFIGFWADLLRQ